MENKIKLRYLDIDGGVKEIEIDIDNTEHQEIAQSAGDDVWEKELVSIDGIPEFKMETCHRRVGRGRFSTNVPYPCLYTRTSKQSLVLKVFYPRDVEEAVRDSIIECAKDGAIAAAATAIPLFSTPASATVALQAGLLAFKEKFVDCIGPELLSKVSYDIEHKSTSGDWHRT